MKALLIRANPRKSGYTQHLTDLFLQGLQATASAVRDVDLTDLSIKHCLGCFHCWMNTPGKCIHPDDMELQLEYLLEADTIVCATPLYYFSMSSYLKTYFERTFPLLRPGIVVSERGISRNRIRYPEKWKGKSLIALVVGALQDPEAYPPAKETFRLIADSIGLNWGGQLTRSESYLLDYPYSKPMTLKKIETAFIEAGKQAGAEGRLSESTIQAASLPLIASTEQFRTYSNLFWSSAEQAQPGVSLMDVPRIVGNDVRILMREMVRCFDSKAAGRQQIRLQFNFPDQQLAYCIHIQNGECELLEGHSDKFDLRVQCSASDWASLFTRQADPRDLLRSSKITLEGDKSLFARLERLFPPPSL